MADSNTSAKSGETQNDTPAPVRLRDYQPPHFKLHETRLDFHLDPKSTRVVAEIDMEMTSDNRDLVFDGEKLALIMVAIDGKELTLDDFHCDDEKLVIEHEALPAGRFTLSTEVLINPRANTELSGLYLSNKMYCTQCEAEGFRRITFYPDRPDVLTTFRVRVHGGQPVKLSNGNLVSDEDGVAEWYDPWPKPSYLFALVAGDLAHISDNFTTVSGKHVDLRIYVRHGNEDLAGYAMDALKRSMAWDEEKYGREYDLDRFNIVAVEDFNSGAMENKGLNIFNAALVLASPETATDSDYQRIESVIAHEYFHNWTGNRITCRDWFQLSLKEGLTVFRDQQFSEDMRSKPVERIKQVADLRARQFAEDASPLAHPVRPESYHAIDNFYTSTIYEKGAEVIRMLHSLVGKDDYARALDLYFERHDGEAATIEDWLKVFEDTTGRDLSAFKRWYHQAGTPRVSVKEKFEKGEYALRVKQTLPETPDGGKKDWQVIPLDYAVFDHKGKIIREGQIELDREKVKLKIPYDGKKKPVLSLNRGFSAPVIVEQKRDPAEDVHLLRHETDDFTRFEIAQELASDTILAGKEPDADYCDALVELARDGALDPAFRAAALGIPTLGRLVSRAKHQGDTPDPDALYTGRIALRKAIAAHYGAERLEADFAALDTEADFDPAHGQAGARALRGALLNLRAALLEGGVEFAREAYANAKNMTETLNALSVLIASGAASDELKAFHERWQGDGLVLNKWFQLQASLTPPDMALETVDKLLSHPDFSRQNPNRFRSVVGGFAAGNLAGFHRPDGRGYDLMAREIVNVDATNPSLSARLVTVFQSWRDFDDTRQKEAREALELIASGNNQSKDLKEMVSRLLAE